MAGVMHGPTGTPIAADHPGQHTVITTSTTRRRE
jgi:hypothetical protein